MKRKFVILMAMLPSLMGMAQEYATQGDGKAYTLATLAATDGTGVSLENGIYTLSGQLTIAEGDSFKMDEGVTVRFADGASLTVKGAADLRCANGRTRLTLADDGATSDGIDIQNNVGVTEVSNLDFEYVGLRNYSPTGMNVSHCTFDKHKGAISGALFLGTSGASFKISDCQFANSRKAAIATAANFACNIEISRCTFTHNSLANGNVPQLNLSAGPQVTVEDCVIEGDSTLTMVGGIGIANWMGTEGYHVDIERCVITDNRYGITTMGILDVVIKDNEIVNNKFETNANNGGSGISLYDPYYKQTAMISGNHIERNLWGITVIGCGEVNIGKTEVTPDAPDYNPGSNVFAGNGNNGALYDLYNNSTNTVYAQGNIWGVATQDSTSIEEVIFHKNDYQQLGEVIFMPAGDTEGISHVAGNESSRNIVYDLRGVRHTYSPALPAGIYIVDGKKFMKK